LSSEARARQVEARVDVDLSHRKHVQFQRNKSFSRNVGIDMTPMIDIVFQLLIFFLVTAQMAEQTRARLSLPQEEGERVTDRALSGLTINLLADGTLVVNDTAVAIDDLDGLVEDAIRAAGGAERLKPLIRADRACDAARLNEVFSRLSARGLSAIRLATERGR
jgi:biopolymer transport protein ExbD